MKNIIKSERKQPTSAHKVPGNTKEDTDDGNAGKDVFFITAVQVVVHSGSESTINTFIPHRLIFTAFLVLYMQLSVNTCILGFINIVKCQD